VKCIYEGCTASWRQSWGFNSDFPDSKSWVIINLYKVLSFQLEGGTGTAGLTKHHHPKISQIRSNFFRESFVYVCMCVYIYPKIYIHSKSYFSNLVIQFLKHEYLKQPKGFKFMANFSSRKFFHLFFLPKNQISTLSGKIANFKDYGLFTQ
jgi:hypothetical protein